jgi:glycosyltransferase involved in cell wall biosynthesis
MLFSKQLFRIRITIAQAPKIVKVQGWNTNQTMAMKDTPSEVSVVIPTYNRKALLKEAILSLFQQDYPKDRYEIIVVDNSSTDGTAQMIAELRDNAPCGFKYFKKENEGPAGARNVGIRSSKGKIIGFTDSDCIAPPDWIKNGVRYFDADDIAFVSGQVFPKPNQTVSFFSPFRSVTKENHTYPACNIFYRKDVLVSSGGFDEGFRTKNERPEGGEDAELAWRVKRGGWKNVFAKDVIIYHELHRKTLVDMLIKDSWRSRKVPLILREVPELREKRLVFKCFMNRKRPLIYMLMSGILLSIIFGKTAPLLLCTPYVFISISSLISDSKNISDIPKTVAIQSLMAIHDVITAIICIYSSIKYRSIVL